MIKSITNLILNLKYLKLTKMDITRFAMKLFICNKYLCFNMNPNPNMIKIGHHAIFTCFEFTTGVKIPN